MRLDATTLKDLSIFGPAGEDVFALLDHTTTQHGRDALRRHIQQPPDSLDLLQRHQDVTRWWLAQTDAWTDKISNGTLVMVEKFFESADNAAAPPAGISLIMGATLQRWLNRNQYTFVEFSLSHLVDFLKGCTELAALLDTKSLPPLLHTELTHMREQLSHPLVGELRQLGGQLSYTRLTRMSFRARRELKSAAQRLMYHYARLDAWRALALAAQSLGWVLPQLLPSAPVRLSVSGLYHPLLQQPVPYDIHFDADSHFLLLTGANMSGKTTFMRALGVGALLAHIGGGVPAKTASFSFLKGIITNMHVEDNILRGESFFFAEVQRMKQTAQRIAEDAPFLVLMDELFKGTNVYDAYECTRAVVDGLLSRPVHVMLLSTHLHEVARHFEHRADMQFAYFETRLGEGSYDFTYALKPGISDDRIGYRILKEQGVIDLLRGE